MTVEGAQKLIPVKVGAAFAVSIMLAMSLSPLVLTEGTPKILEDYHDERKSSGVAPWSDGGQAWPQPGRTPDRISTPPGHVHSSDSGDGLLSIVDPVINWDFGSDPIGTESLGTPIADFSTSLTTDPSSEERCGGDSLYTILVQTDAASGESYLRIIEGEDSDLAWEVSLGTTEKVKASPLVVDLDDDAKPEVIAVYDQGGALKVDAWSPRLFCSVTGWDPGVGSSQQPVWTWEDDDLMVSSDVGAYVSGWLGGHKPTAQPLLADLDLDGDAELVVAAVNENSGDPVIVAMSLPSSGSPATLWEKTLDKGSHPSDPAFARTDENTGYVVLTTTEYSNGGMWVWRLDSLTGDSGWDGLSLNNIDGDSDAPHIRLPGPVVANLDSDETPEIVVTIPTDADGSGAVDGAEFRGLEISTGSEIWSFEADNGYADAPPIVIDTDEDGTIDRVCWVTWWQTATARHGVTGCHDVDGSNPEEAWHRDLEQSSGAPNDEIAVSPPVWMDIDGSGEPELLVAYGRSLWAFDGAEGTGSAINTEWTNELELNHRTWSSPALADIDGDETLDIVIGSTVVSLERSDVRPLLDGGGIELDPTAPSPGEDVTVSAFIENSGTGAIDTEFDAVLYADGIEIGRRTFTSLDPVEPTGSGSFETFSVEWSGPLGDHEFILELDSFGNLTQTRTDNDIASKIVSIVPTYNASFEIPTEPTRVTPGSSTTATPTVRSTGRLAGTWSLSIDDSQLPDGWTWSDSTPGGISNIEIGVDETWSPDLTIDAPSDALGSDSGYLSLTLTLDEDSNVSVSANLPIEANRTRGLSLRGPDGTAQSSGYGLSGQAAEAWFMAENLGNAEEDQILLSWDSTSWGNDLRLYDMEGAERSALILGPGEELALVATLSVPSNAPVGDSVGTPLTMCVGTGTDEETCQTIQLTFHSSNVVSGNHIRSVPANGLGWSIISEMPDDVGTITWSLSEMGMALPGWSWMGTGDISVSGDSITISGSPGGASSGSIIANLPEDASPAFHYFTGTSQESSEHHLIITLEVLQIFRSNVTVISPQDQPFVVDVEEESLVVLRLENPGNGDDIYSLDYSVVLDSNIPSDPGVVVEFSIGQVVLTSGSLTTVPVTVTLPESTPAGVPLWIEFTATSLGDTGVSSSDAVALEARQDHRWEIVASVDSVSVANGSVFVINPGASLSLDFDAKNVGNLEDEIYLDVVTSIDLVDGDSSTDWSSNGDSAENVAVNQTVSMSIVSTIDAESWSGSSMNVIVSASSQGEEVATFSFTIEAGHVPSWNAIADQANLEIDPFGSQVELTVVQTGNSPTRAYASMFITGESGWSVDEPGELPVLSPGETAPLILNITPPENAVHGRAVELHLRLREGDASVVSEIVFPLRVAVTHDFTLSGEGGWLVSDLGGHPLAMLENLGNAPSTISLQVLSLPLGWSVSGRTEVVLGVGEITGVPLELMPSEDWDGSVKTIRILAEDIAGNQREINLDTEEGDFSWANSPVIVSTSGDRALLEIHGTTAGSSVIDSVSGSLSWSTLGGWAWPATSSGSGTISVSSGSYQGELAYKSIVVEPATRGASCTVYGSIGEVTASCTIGNGTDAFDYAIILIDDLGDMMVSQAGTVGRNSTAMVNLTSDEWDPLPGNRDITIRLLDSRGILVTSHTQTFEVRRTDWNVGLVELELDGQGAGQKIEISTRRENYELLPPGTQCSIFIEAGEDYNSVHMVDMTSANALAPKPSIDRPDVEDGTEMVATIRCDFPWDQDSDPSDNEARVILSGGEELESGISDSSTAVAAAAMVIGASIALSWMVSNYREGREMMEKTRLAVEKKALEKRAALKEKDIAKENEVLPESTEKDNDEGVPEGPSRQPSSEIQDDSFESRLNRLMGER
ncbi:MAG: hypothetical protein CMB53_00120 [Euryarchaeota archaeon]|nr:hypothetical protein [Euryarchaeota archaeon]|tara:strand:- start:8433 stop:14075 length:5643 start_codon:yes stop_codon:yes gene_type:complete